MVKDADYTLDRRQSLPKDLTQTGSIATPSEQNTFLLLLVSRTHRPLWAVEIRNCRIRSARFY